LISPDYRQHVIAKTRNKVNYLKKIGISVERLRLIWTLVFGNFSGYFTYCGHKSRQIKVQKTSFDSFILK